MTAPFNNGSRAGAQCVARSFSSPLCDCIDGSGGALAGARRFIYGPDDDGNLLIGGRVVRTHAFAPTAVTPCLDGRDGEFGSDCMLSPQEWDGFTQRVLNAGTDPAGEKWLYPSVGDKESVYGHIVMTFSRLTNFQDGSFSDDAGFHLVDALHDYWWMAALIMGETLVSTHFWGEGDSVS